MEPNTDTQAVQSLSIQVDNATMSIELADTDAARELASKASQGDIVVTLRPYGGFEQVGGTAADALSERSANHDRGWGCHALPRQSNSHLSRFELLVLYPLGEDRWI